MPFFYIWLGGAVAFLLTIIISVVHKDEGFWKTDFSQTIDFIMGIVCVIFWPVVFVALLFSKRR